MTFRLVAARAVAVCVAAQAAYLIFLTVHDYTRKGQR